MTNLKTDILIIGGGIAGCIAAISLVDTHRVILIDKLSEPVDRIGECLAPAARRVLKHLDLLEGLENIVPGNKQNSHLKNIGTQSYWGSDKVHIVDNLRNPDGFGWHLNRKVFETYLREIAAERGANCLWSTKLYNSHYEDSLWNVKTISTNETSTKETFITTKFIIDASGRQSHFTRSLGIKRQHLDKLIACWATLPNYEEHKMGTISASEIGWWYSAPLPNNQRVLALQTDSDLIDRDALKDLNSFLHLSKGNSEITKILSKTPNKTKYQGTISANSTRLNEVVGQQWVALGDAAISFDPLSSQGMFNAMANALQLGELIKKFDFLKDMNPNKMVAFNTIYEKQVNEIWEHYLKHKNIFYRQEMRWKEAPFWKRRH